MTVPTRDTLSGLIEFDQPFTIGPDGSLSFPREVWAPSVYLEVDGDGQYVGGPDIDDDSWSFVDGFSGQYRYAGPIMHASEFLGGRMAQHVLETPGTYVVTVPYPLDGSEPDGWVLLYSEPPEPCRCLKVHPARHAGALPVCADCGTAVLTCHDEEDGIRRTYVGATSDRWVHDEQRDGAGCGWCGRWAQVNDEGLCAECFEQDNDESEIS